VSLGVFSFFSFFSLFSLLSGFFAFSLTSFFSGLADSFLSTEVLGGLSTYGFAFVILTFLSMNSSSLCNKAASKEPSSSRVI
jgi:hypothetical protein